VVVSHLAPDSNLAAAGTAPRMSRTSDLMREINRYIRQRAAPDEDVPLSLFCECLTNDCYGAVRLGSQAFDVVENDARTWIVMVGHETPRMRVEPSCWAA
jgi:hypothetical protein